jgi:beta-glucosidase
MAPSLRRAFTVLLTCAIAGAFAVPAELSAQDGDRPWLDRGRPPDERARLLLGEMTLEEKVSLMHGSGGKNVGGEFFQVHVRGIERLGIPDLTLADGATGMRGGTQLPAPIALAASFSRESPGRFGDLLGSETRDMGYGVVLGPTLDLARTPLHGRTFESFGEDPYLMGEIAVPEVRAIQDHDVQADAKHFAGNNIERLRRVLDVQITERVAHELYLPYYEAVIRQGGLFSIMCAFNKFNGVSACDDGELLNELLRDRWGFAGWVRNDHTAYHHVESAENGLDLEMPTGWVFDDNLVAAVRDGRVGEATIDRSVHRFLRAMFASGTFDDPPQRVGVPVEKHARVARQLAEDGTVLLKNERGALPLDPAATESIAVIGSDADTTATYGGGSTNIEPATKDTILDAIRARAPDADVRFARGVDPVGPGMNAPGFDTVPSGVLTAADGSTPGLTATYYRGADFSDPIETRVEPGVYQDDGWYATGGTSHPRIPAGTQTARWAGTFTAPADGEYGFDLSSFDPSRLYFDGDLLIDNAGQHDDAPKSATVQLEAGQSYELRVEYEPHGANPHVAVADNHRRIKLGWSPPPGAVDANVEAAAELAARSEVAVVVVRDYMSEAQDRPHLRLPSNQDALVREVAAANPNTIVVLTTGSAVSMPWVADVPAVVAAWYGGTAGGAALARVLFGDVNPAGRLPITFPRRDRDTPTATPEQFPGVERVARYSEGLRVGYRHYLATGTEPLFPFGHGLSYTTFRYGRPRLDRAAFVAYAAPGAQRSVTVSFDVENTGERTGAVVPQVYVEFPRHAGEPSYQLKGFDKVRLEPGERRRVAVQLDQRAFAVYDPAADGWKVLPGAYRVHVADAADDLRLSRRVKVVRSAGAPHLELTPPAFLAPGSEMRLTGVLVNDGDFPLTRPQAELLLPAGWSARGGAVPPIVRPHARIPVAWTLRVPEGAPPDEYRLGARLEFRAGPSAAASTTRATTHVPYESLGAAFNNRGISDDSASAAADLDGEGRSLSAQALAARGYSPGATVTADGASFTWPDTAPGEADNVATDGQAIRLEGAGRRLSLLATSTAGLPTSGDRTAGRVTVVYADGGAEHETPAVTDWRANRPAAGSATAVTVPYFNTDRDNCPPPARDGSRCQEPVSVYVASVPVDPGRDVAGVILPRLSPSPEGPVATMHVFAIGWAPHR